MSQTRQLGALLRAMTLLGALSQVTGLHVTGPTIGLAAWPAFEVPPFNQPISVSGDGTTVIQLDAAGTTWRRGSSSVTYSPSFLLLETSYDGSYYPSEWTPHPSWQQAGSSETQPWPIQFPPTGLSGDGTTYYGIYFDGPE